jgi:hypothetical protein
MSSDLEEWESSVMLCQSACRKLYELNPEHELLRWSWDFDEQANERRGAQSQETNLMDHIALNERFWPKDLSKEKRSEAWCEAVLNQQYYYALKKAIETEQEKRQVLART